MKAYLRHPETGLIVSTEGEVYLPKSGARQQHWTVGSGKNYLGVKYKGKIYRIHRLVAETFILNPDDKPEVDHINRDTHDNRVENLRWATHQENMRNMDKVERLDIVGVPHRWEDPKGYFRIRARIIRRQKKQEALA